jgi:hypothetical protein
LPLFILSIVKQIALECVLSVKQFLKARVQLLSSHVLLCFFFNSVKRNV